jgi:hypothetical protein
MVAKRNLGRQCVTDTASFRKKEEEEEDIASLEFPVKVENLEIKYGCQAGTKNHYFCN